MGLGTESKCDANDFMPNMSLMNGWITWLAYQMKRKALNTPIKPEADVILASFVLSTAFKSLSVYGRVWFASPPPNESLKWPGCCVKPVVVLIVKVVLSEVYMFWRLSSIGCWIDHCVLCCMLVLEAKTYKYVFPEVIMMVVVRCLGVETNNHPQYKALEMWWVSS